MANRMIRLTDIEATFRRPGQAPPAQQQGIPPQQLLAQQQAELQKAREASELARRKSQKPVDRSLPDGLNEHVIGNGVKRYNQLREVERKLDATMTRKRLDINDAHQHKRRGTLRIWVSNTVENQPWQASAMEPEAFDFSSNVEATFRVKIEGRLLDDGADLAEDVQVNPAAVSTKDVNARADVETGLTTKRVRLSSPPTRQKLSHFFKAIYIDMDRARSIQPDGYTSIEWRRSEGPPSVDPSRESDFDCLEFQRKSDENINITINLYRDEQPEQYRLAPPLATLLDMEDADRKTVLLGVWEYIKAAGLQEEDESRRIICDERLKNALGTDAFYFPHLPDLIQRSMFELPPVKLAYTIRVDQDFHASGTPEATIYDIPVLLDDPLRDTLRQIIQSPTHGPTLQNIARIDDRLALVVQAMTHSKAKHGFFTSMSVDPANFVNRWISSQKRDLDVVLGSGVRGEGDWQSPEWRKGGADGPWGSSEAWEGVGSFLSRVKA